MTGLSSTVPPLCTQQTPPFLSYHQCCKRFSAQSISQAIPIGDLHGIKGWVNASSRCHFYLRAISAFRKSGTATSSTPTCTGSGWQSMESGADGLCYILISFLIHLLQADVFYTNTNLVAKSILERESQDVSHNPLSSNIFIPRSNQNN